MLAIMLTSILTSAAGALRQTHVTIDVPIPAELVDPADPFSGNWRRVMQDYVATLYPGASTAELRERRDPVERRAVPGARRGGGRPSLIGGHAHDHGAGVGPLRPAGKGYVDRDAPEAERRLNDAQIAAFDALAEQGKISSPLNWGCSRSPTRAFPSLRA
jgi:phosphate transport system permease protein